MVNATTHWFEHINTLPQHEILPGMRGRFLHSDTMTFAFWEIAAGFDLPGHRHPHEQVSHIIDGTFVLTIGDDSRLLEAGAIAVIPGQTHHSGKALTCHILDIFSPRREDY